MRLSRQHMHAMFEHCASTRAEVCGILIGQCCPQLEITAVIPGRNVHPTPTRHFLLDAASLLRTDTLCSRSNSEIVGFYHSHPHGRALPSLQDRQAAWPGMRMVIVAVVDGIPRYLCAWQLDAERRLLPQPIMPL